MNHAHLQERGETSPYKAIAQDLLALSVRQARYSGRNRKAVRDRKRAREWFASPTLAAGWIELAAGCDYDFFIAMLQKRGWLEC